MSVFFDGKQIVTPAVNTVVDTSAMFNSNQSPANTLALVGACSGGKPNTPLYFQSPSDALAVLGSGPLADAIARAFSPSDEVPGPAKICAIRVNPALPSALTLNDSAAGAALVLTTVDYGDGTKQTMVKVEAGTVNGVKLTTQKGSEYYVADNVYAAPLTVRYAGGEASGTVSVSNTTVVLSAPTGTPVATIPLATYATVQQLADYINTVPGFSAVVNGSYSASPALNGLDLVTAQDVKTAAFAVPAVLQAVVSYFNSGQQPFVTAARADTGNLPPAPLPFTFLTGGTDGTTTNTEWANAFTTLQGEDVQWVVPVSGDPSLISMADAHAIFCSNVLHSRRRVIAGTPLGTSDAVALAEALALNSPRTSLVHIGGYDFNSDGALTLYAPFIVAAMIAGGFAGSAPGTPMTNKSLRLQGVERQLKSPVDTDPLINGGVLPIQKTKTGYRVVQSISTWLTDGNYVSVEQSTGAAMDFTCTTVEEAVRPMIGTVENPQNMALVASMAETALRNLSKPAPVGPGVLVGDAKSPPFKNLTVSINGDVTAIQFQASPGIPNNYINITVFAVPYAGTVAAA